MKQSFWIKTYYSLFKYQINNIAVILFFIVILFSCKGISKLQNEEANQNQETIEDIQSHPKLVLEEIFRAAREQDYSNLSKLCHIDIDNDGDTQRYICDIASASDDGKKEFISYFKNARITGEVDFSTYQNLKVTARVPFWFNHPGGESRSNETMNMVNIDGKWYLDSF